jgi:hypothetical protein
MIGGDAVEAQDQVEGGGEVGGLPAEVGVDAAVE